MTHVNTPFSHNPAISMPDTEVEIRFTRLAKETTGYTRNVMLRLADEAHQRALMVTMSEKTIDLHIVPNSPGSPRSTFRTYG